MIIENLASALNEESQWKFPHEFNPENFLNEQGEFVKPEAFLPFSAGMKASTLQHIASTARIITVFDSDLCCRTPCVCGRRSGPYGALHYHGDSAPEV